MSNLRHMLSKDEAWLLEILFWLRPVALKVPPALASVVDALVQRGLVRFERGGMGITGIGIEAHRAECSRAPAAQATVTQIRRAP